MANINGNSITEEDLKSLQQMHRRAKEFSKLFDTLSPGCQQFLYETHSEDTWLGHIARWGEQNTGEAIADIDACNNMIARNAEAGSDTYLTP